MPTELDESAIASTETVPQPNVLDVSLFDKEQRAVQYLQYAGLISGDENVTTLNLLKLVNHAAFADEKTGNIPLMQEAFRTQMASMDMDALTGGGIESPVFKLVDGVLAERIAKSQQTIAELDALPSTMEPMEFMRTRQRAEARIKKYEKDRAYYQSNPEAINKAVREHPQALTSGKYLPLGRLAVQAGMISGDPEMAKDMVDDTLANAAAHSLLHVAEEVMSTSDADLALNKRFPERYRSNIIAKATDTAVSTTGIEEVKLFDDATPELARIQALKTMLSAHLHEMTKHTRDENGNSNPPLEQLADALTQVKPLARKYQSAAMSLAYHFLGEGAGQDDARMQKLREHLAGMMEKNGIPLMMQKDEADRAATALAEESAKYLREKEAKAVANVNALLAKVKPDVAKVISMAEKYANAPADTFVEAAQRPAATAVGLGK
ncbi:MAG: hypothetical protein ACK502_06615 [Alphaproteobacteria bacterium]